MKLKITLLMAIFFLGFASAQTKVGTVDSDYIISKMPEMKKVLTLIENYGKKLDTTFQVKYKEYQTKVAAYKKDEKILSPETKKTMIVSLSKLEQDLQKYRQNGNKLMQLKKDEVMRPLYKKLGFIITEVAKANGYSQILTINGNEFAYVDEKFDITKLVLQKLNIKESNK